MKLWGKIASSLLLVIAAAFLAVAYGRPEERWEAVTVAFVMLAAAAFGVPFIVRLFSSFTGDEDILANGLPFSATIVSFEPTIWRYNRYYPIVRFRLAVDAGGAPYPVDVKQAVDPALLPHLATGTKLDVRVDRKNRNKIVISWRDVARKIDDPAAASAIETPRAFNRAASRINATTGGVIFVVLSLFFAALAYEAWRYETQGVIVQGTATGISGKGKWAYTFTVDGRVLKGTSEALSATASTLKPGGPVEVQYLSDSPETNRIPGQRASYATWLAMTMVAFVAGIALLWRARRQRRAQMKP